MTNDIVCFDSHFHIIDPKCPLTPNQGYCPEPFSTDDYLAACSRLNLSLQGGAIVSGSFQAHDTSYLKHALSQLGSHYVAVINLSHRVSDDEIFALHQLGVRAIRFNAYRGDSDTLTHLETLAKRVYDCARWHVELYISAEKLSHLMPTLMSLPKISIDHLGLSTHGLDDLLTLVDHGALVKATRFSILDFDIASVMRRIYNTNPDSLMFGSDLPSTRAPRLINASDIQLLKRTFDQKEFKKVMHDNAFELYHRRFQ